MSITRRRKASGDGHPRLYPEHYHEEVREAGEKRFLVQMFRFTQPTFGRMPRLPT